MKKFLRIVMGLVLCLLFTACGANTSDNGNNDTDYNMTDDESYTWCIDISMSEDGSTDLQLYLDENQNIIDIYCRIDETEQIASKANPVGKNIKEGLNAILDAGCILGYFSENSTVMIGVFKEPTSLSLYKQLCEYGVDYIFNSNRYFIYSVGLNEDEAASLTGTYERASKDEDGRIWKWEDTYENGKCRSQIGVSNDGATEEIVFFINTGNTEYAKKTLLDGSVLEQKYAQDGSLTYYYEKQPDDSYIEQMYDAQQLVKEARKDSVVEQVTTYEAGNIKSHWTKDASGINESVYSADGKVVEQHQTLPNGTKTSVYFDANGSPQKERVEYSDGSGKITYYDEYGYVIKEEQF